MTKNMIDQSCLDRRATLAGLFAAGLLPASLAEAAAAAGAVETSHGAAKAEARGVMRQLAVGAEVFVGDLVSTGDTARLVMLLGAATRVSLGASTRLKIDKYLAETRGELNFNTGPVLVDRDEKAPHMDLRLRSPFGMIALRGTRVFAGPSNGAFGVFVERGAVDFTAGGATVRINAGQGSDVKRPGDRPTPVKDWGIGRVIDALTSVG